MIRSCQGFSRPFLLEEGSIKGRRCFSAREIVEIVFVPRLAEFLCDFSIACSGRPANHARPRTYNLSKPMESISHGCEGMTTVRKQRMHIST